ncbi:MAG: carbonic anhydrase [Cyanobium sp.]
MHRRHLLIRTALASGVLLRRPDAAAASLDTALQQRLALCTPGDALARLLEGNGRFAAAWAAASGTASAPERQAMLRQVWEGACQLDPQALAQGQRPWAAILSCADARVDPGWIFACTAGELFQVRSAGNTAFPEALASLEYAVSILEVPLVLVMGHSDCGAVKAAMGSGALTPLLEKLVTPIRASLQSRDDLTQAVQGNARYAAGQLTARSAVLKGAVEGAKLSIRSAFFDIGSGRVSLL